MHLRIPFLFYGRFFLLPTTASLAKAQARTGLYKKMLLLPQTRIPIGKTSHDRLRQLKYAAVSAVAMSCRAAIMGGAVEALAYARSDDAILQIDGAKTALVVLKLEIRTLLDYADLVKQTKSAAHYSAAVRACVEYITVHSHRTISPSLQTFYFPPRTPP